MDLVVLSGLQGSGKSTFFHSRFAATHVHVSRDLFVNSRDSLARQRAFVEAAARERRSVVVDNTNARREDRAELVALARELGMRPILYWFPPDVRASLARNAERTGKARVPPVAVLATARRLVAPDRSEGFQATYEVHAAPGGAFVVTARPDLARPAEGTGIVPHEP